MNPTTTSQPRLLVVIPEGIDALTGGSVLTSRLTESWSRDALAYLFVLPTGGESDSQIGNNYMVGGPIPGKLPSMKHIWGFLTGRQVSLDRLFVGRINRPLKDWLKAFAPDLVYAHTGHPWMMDVSMDIARYVGVPLVTHTMDDHYSNFPSRSAAGLLAVIASKRYQTTFRRCVNTAALNLTISSEMAREYREVFNVRFEPVQPFVSTPKAYAKPDSETVAYRRHSIVYAGSVIQQTNSQALERLAEAIRTRNQDKTDSHWILDIYGWQSPQELPAGLREDGVRLMGGVSPAQVERLLPTYSYALLPISDDSKAIQFVRLSFPSKIPELLRARVPIIYLGPKEVGFGRDLVDSGAAIWSQPTVANIIQLLIMLEETSDYERAKIVENGMRYQAACHSEAVESRFIELLNKVLE